MNKSNNNHSFYFIIKAIEIYENKGIQLGFVNVDDENNVDKKYNYVSVWIKIQYVGQLRCQKIRKKDLLWYENFPLLFYSLHFCEIIFLYTIKKCIKKNWSEDQWIKEH